MGLSLKGIGKSISKAFKDVGKTLKKAAPVLIPLAVAGVTGGFSSGGWMGQVGKKLLGGSNLNTILGSLSKGGIAKTVAGVATGKAAGNSIVDPAMTGNEPAQESDGGGNNLFIDLAKKIIPVLATNALEGKPKSASKEAANYYASAPKPQTGEISNYLQDSFKDGMFNPPVISPLSRDARGPLSFGDPMQAKPASPSYLQESTKGAAPNSPMVAPPGRNTRGFISSRDRIQAENVPVLTGRRANYGADPVAKAAVSQAPVTAAQPAGAPAQLAPVMPAGMQTGGNVGSFSAPVAYSPTAEEVEALRNRSRAFAVRGGM